MEQFENVQPVIDLDQRRRVPALELGVRLFARPFQGVVVVFVEILMENERRALGIVHGEHRFQFCRRHGRKALRHKQAAVCGDALGDRPCARHTFSPARADKFHTVTCRLLLVRIRRTPPRRARKKNARKPPSPAERAPSSLPASKPAFCLCSDMFTDIWPRIRAALLWRSCT